MRYLSAAVLLFFTGLVLAAPPSVLEVVSGKVIGVTDGDTINVLVGRETVTVRLEGIDAPEGGQSYGTKSKQALSDLVFARPVTVRKTGIDRYGRTLGFVMMDDVDVNAKLVEDGWAWHFKKYSDEERLAKLEDTAREAKRGLWADAAPLAPWEYRTRQKTARKAADPEALHWLNTSSGVRHNDRCEYFRKTKQGHLCGPSDGKPCGICGG